MPGRSELRPEQGAGGPEAAVPLPGPGQAGESIGVCDAPNSGFGLPKMVAFSGWLPLSHSEKRTLKTHTPCESWSHNHRFMHSYYQRVSTQGIQKHAIVLACGFPLNQVHTWTKFASIHCRQALAPSAGLPPAVRTLGLLCATEHRAERAAAAGHAPGEATPSQALLRDARVYFCLANGCV